MRTAIVAAVFAALNCMLDVQAAQIAWSKDPECRVDIIGPIKRGDFASLEALEEHLVVHDGESTSTSVICLDSPGGDVKAGLAIANFVLEKGVSTRIRSGKECHSICAIVFMMGNYRGGEVAGLSRRMHITSQLGFHRPYISLKEARSYTSGEMAAAYDFAMRTVFEFLTLANQREPWGTSQMIEPDLLQRMMGTPPDQMFLLRTVEQALRWGIEIDGLPIPKGVGMAHILFACENALATRVSLTTELAGEGLLTRDIFKLEPISAYHIGFIVEGPKFDASAKAYQVASQRAGYASVGCEVARSGDGVAVCGYDGETDVHLGDCGEAYGRRFFGPLSLYHPATDLIALALVQGNAPDAAKVRRCQVLNERGDVADDDPCIQEVVFVPDDSAHFMRHLITWPSGARTVIEIRAGDSNNAAEYRINGKAAAPTGKPDCLLNTESGNTFCLGY